MVERYSSPVDRLLTCGDPRNQALEWPNYLDLGLTEAHIPDLIRMATDPDLNWADSDSLDVWAPIHAWRALGQLRAVPAVEPLLGLLWLRNDDNYGYDDWSGEELPEVFGLIGPAAIPALKNYMAQHAGDDDEFPDVAGRSLVEIAERHPEARDEAVATLTEQLEKFMTNAREFNAGIIADLVDLQAVEAAAVIRSAFAAKRVDLTIGGNWFDVRDDLHLDPSITFPGPEPEDEPIPPLFDWLGKDRLPLPQIDPYIPPVSTGHNKPKPVNKKAKRRQEKKSRKLNRKRK